jgi:hypothetical protein
MTFRVNGGIINQQTLTGSLRFFKMTAAGTEFQWTVSDGTVNLPVSSGGGAIAGPGPFLYYFVVGNNISVPNSVAEIALQTISEKCGIVMISIQPALYAGTLEIQFACSASAFGWGSDAPPYSVPPANMPEDLTAAATEMTAAVQAIPDRPIHTVYYGGCANQQTAPIDNVVPVSFGGIVITEVPFVLV